MNHRTSLMLRRIGRNLAAARLDAGLTQAEVAARMGARATQVARMERGEHDTGISRYLDAAWAVGMPPGDLFRRLDTRMP